METHEIREMLDTNKDSRRIMRLIETTGISEDSERLLWTDETLYNRRDSRGLMRFQETTGDS